MNTKAKIIGFVVCVVGVVGCAFIGWTLFGQPNYDAAKYEPPICSAGSKLSWREINLDFEGSERQVDVACVKSDGSLRITDEARLYDKETGKLLQKKDFIKKEMIQWARGGTIRHFTSPTQDCDDKVFCNPASGWCYLFSFPCQTAVDLATAHQ